MVIYFCIKLTVNLSFLTENMTATWRDRDREVKWTFIKMLYDSVSSPSIFALWIALKQAFTHFIRLFLMEYWSLKDNLNSELSFRNGERSGNVQERWWMLCNIHTEQDKRWETFAKSLSRYFHVHALTALNN